MTMLNGEVAFPQSNAHAERPRSKMPNIKLESRMDSSPVRRGGATTHAAAEIATSDFDANRLGSA
jgi:hypothetical protein